MYITAHVMHDINCITLFLFFIFFLFFALALVYFKCSCLYSVHLYEIRIHVPLIKLITLFLIYSIRKPRYQNGHYCTDSWFLELFMRNNSLTKQSTKYKCACTGSTSKINFSFKKKWTQQYFNHAKVYRGKSNLPFLKKK